MPYPALPRVPRGFTLIELLVVVVLIAVGAATVTLAMRDPAASRLEREAARLVALLESARAESRASGVTVIWVPQAGTPPDGQVQADFQFIGLPVSSTMPTRWLGPDVVPELGELKGVVLGPEPLIPPQAISLRLERQRIKLQTDGLGPFVVVGSEELAALP